MIRMNVKNWEKNNRDSVGDENFDGICLVRIVYNWCSSVWCYYQIFSWVDWRKFQLEEDLGEKNLWFIQTEIFNGLD